MLRNLPSVSELLQQPAIIELIDTHGRQPVTQWVRRGLDRLREELLAANAEDSDAPDRDSLRARAVEQIANQAEQAESLQLHNVINATGVVLHTGLGRAPLSASAKQALLDVAGTANVEVDLESGGRRYRGYQLEPSFQILTGCESSLIVNNNAAATLLTLQALCQGREVVISRGELIEIGGSFRLPEIFELSGAILKEVGTTNRTKLSDYERAIGPDTAAIMHVHPSNYRVVGFADKPAEADMFALAKQHNLVAIDDIGSGALFDVTEFGLPCEPTFQHSIAAGADIVLGSGDKLLGGPQSGIILGSADHVERCRQHPLARAVRVDKFTLGSLAATLDSYTREAAREEIPTLSMLQASQDDLRSRAEFLKTDLGEIDGLHVEVRDDTAQVGGGSLPAIELPTAVVALRHNTMSADEFATRLRVGRIHVFARIHKDDVLLDLRSVQPEDDSRLALAVRLVRVD